MLSKEEKIESLRKVDGETLLASFLIYFTNYDPYNEDAAETYKLTLDEVKRRLGDGGIHREVS